MISCLLILSSCIWLDKPSRTDVISKIKGTYCSKGDPSYQLIISEDGYKNYRRYPGILQSDQSIEESCQGKYELSYKENQWIIHFIEDEDPKAVFDHCERTFTLWARGRGYIIENDSLVLYDLFDGTEVVKGTCE